LKGGGEEKHSPFRKRARSEPAGPNAVREGTVLEKQRRELMNIGKNFEKKGGIRLNRRQGKRYLLREPRNRPGADLVALDGSFLKGRCLSDKGLIGGKSRGGCRGRGGEKLFQKHANHEEVVCLMAKI